VFGQWPREGETLRLADPVRGDSPRLHLVVAPVASAFSISGFGGSPTIVAVSVRLAANSSRAGNCRY
jgi:hypothetical protein